MSGAAWHQAFAAGGLDQKLNAVLAAGGVLQPGGGFLAPDGTRWDSGGNLIGGEQFDGEPSPFAPVGFHNGEPYNQGTVDAAEAAGMTVGDFIDQRGVGAPPAETFAGAMGDAADWFGGTSGAVFGDPFQEPPERVDAPLGQTGTTQPYGDIYGEEGFLDTGPGQDLSFEAAMAKYGWEDLLRQGGEREEAVVDPRTGLTEEQAIAAQVGQYAIDLDAEGGGYGTEADIYSDWLSTMVDVPGEGLVSRSQLNDPNYWERIGAEYLEDPVSARIAEQVRQRQAEIDYATEFPQGQYLSEYPYTYIPGSKPEVAAGDLTPASWATSTRPRIFDPVLGAYRESTVADAATPGAAAFTGEAMRGRNLGEQAILSPAVGAAGYTGAPVPTVEPSTIAPWERARAIESITEEPFYGGIDFIPDVRVEPEERGFMDVMADIIPFYDPSPVQAAAPVPVQAAAPVPAPTYVAPEIFPEDMGFVSLDPEPESAARWYDEGAKGIRTRDRMALVGESGPELALFPNGTEIIPLDRKMKPDQARRLRRRGEFAKTIDSFQFGGFIGDMGPEVTDLPLGAQVMPAGITEMMTGRPTRQPRSLMRQAGMRTPSAQTISNLLPEEIEVYREMGRMAGIPEKAFEREFRSMVPMGQGGTRQARFTPRGTGRTRYGNR